MHHMQSAFFLALSLSFSTKGHLLSFLVEDFRSQQAFHKQADNLANCRTACHNIEG